MSYTLILGDYAYSSWSLRGWLIFDAFGLPARRRLVSFAQKSVAEQLSDLPPLRTVPAAIDERDGSLMWDSLALAEEIAARNPEAGIWPENPKARAAARSLAAEMHSGFSALRGDCPMNLRAAYEGFEPSDAVLGDLRRIEAIWNWALDAFGGPWLCGAYSAADAFFAPVAARIATYGLPLGDAAQSYVARHLAHPPFRRWRAMGLVHGPELPWYEMPLPRVAWPGPAARAARAVDSGPSENTACPYSGRPVAHFLETGGRIFGFCNPFCRDKTVADPEAWPAFMALLDGT